MALTGFHLRVAQLLGESIGDLGFGLGGGYGLQVHQIADRPSKDLDAYVNVMDPEVFAAAERALCDRIEAAGLTARVVGTNDWFRAVVVSGEGADEQVVIDLAYDYRANPPVIVEGIGPVLHVEDIVTGKVRAFVDRGAERDYSDVASILRTRRWTVHDLYSKAHSMRPEVSRAQFAHRLAQADQMDLDEYAAIGIGPAQLKNLQHQLRRAAQELVNGVSGQTGPGMPGLSPRPPNQGPPAPSV